MNQPTAAQSGDDAHTTDTFGWGGAATLSPFEALMWRLDRFDNLRAAVTGVEMLDCSPDRERLIAAHERGMKALPRLRQKLVTRGNDTVVWQNNPDDNVHRHLQILNIGPTASLRDVFDAAQTFSMAPFDREQSPWAALLLEGLEDGRAAYVLKLHHAMSDGIGIIQLLSFVHSRTREPGGAPASQRRIGAPDPAGSTVITPLSTLGSTARSLGRWTRQAIEAASEESLAGHHEPWVSRAARYAASLRRVMAPERVPGSPLLAQRSQQWHFDGLDLPLAALRSAARACGATVNDAFVSGLLGAVERYHAAFGTVPEEIPISIPISIRSEDDGSGGNHFAPAQLVAPLAGSDPKRRMHRIAAQVRALRSEPALVTQLRVMSVVASLPTRVAGRALGAITAANDLQVSNVPGLRETVYIAGSKVEAFYPFAPLPGCPAMISLVSHEAHCYIGLNVDTGAFTDTELLMRCMRESFDEILNLAKEDAN